MAEEALWPTETPRGTSIDQVGQEFDASAYGENMRVARRKPRYHWLIEWHFLALLAFTLGVAYYLLMAPIPLGLIALQRAGSSGSARAMLCSPPSVGSCSYSIVRGRDSLWADFVFIFAYGWAFTTACAMSIRLAATKRGLLVAWVGLFLSVAAVVADITQDVLTALALDAVEYGEPNSYVADAVWHATAAATSATIGLFYAAFGIAVPVMTVYLARSFRTREVLC